MSVLIPMRRADSLSISVARIALPVLVFFKNRTMHTEVTTLPMEPTILGMLSLISPMSQVPSSMRGRHETEVRRPEIDGQVGQEDADPESDNNLGQHRPLHHLADYEPVYEHPQQEQDSRKQIGIEKRGSSP